MQYKQHQRQRAIWHFKNKSLWLKLAKALFQEGENNLNLPYLLLKTKPPLSSVTSQSHQIRVSDEGLAHRPQMTPILHTHILWTQHRTSDMIHMSCQYFSSPLRLLLLSQLIYHRCPDKPLNVTPTPTRKLTLNVTSDPPLSRTLNPYLLTGCMCDFPSITSDWMLMLTAAWMPLIMLSVGAYMCTYVRVHGLVETCVCVYPPVWGKTLCVSVIMSIFKMWVTRRKFWMVWNDPPKRSKVA